MKLIYDIFRKLRNQEIRQIRQTISQSSFSFDKVGKLFELVTRYDEKEESFYSQKLYGKDPDNTFRVSKSRLKRMLENVILQDKSLSGYNAPVINARLQVRKKLLQGEILLGRGAYGASKNLLLQVISTANKFHLHQEAFQAELLLYRHQTVLTSVKDQEKSTLHLLEANRLNALINEALILQYSIANQLRHQTVKDEELADIRLQIDRMKEISEETQHPQVLSAFYLTYNYYLQVIQENETALAYCEKYLALLQNEPSQHSPQRMAGAYVQLAKVSILLGKMDEARKYSSEVLSRYSDDELNSLIGLELAFRIAYYSRNYDEAKELIQKAFRHPRFEEAKILAAQWYYFYACVLFQTGEYQDAYAQLNHTTPLLSDKYGRNITIRLLEIMILFELSHHDIMETKILNMRQYVKRTQAKKELFRPAKLIQILMHWYKRNYDFSNAVQASEKNMMALKDYHQIHPRDFASDFELIRLEEWLESKLGGNNLI
ncbi:MAG: hypothetical protein AAF206_17020 [Bacteroidota bacterium]